MFKVTGDTVFADISKFLEVCGFSVPGTVHAVWNDGDSTAAGVNKPGMNSVGSTDPKPITLHDLEQSVKDLNDIIEAARRLGLNPEADGRTRELDELFKQVNDRLEAMKRAASDANRQAQEDASTPLVGEDQAQGQEQQPGMEAGGIDMGGGAPMDLSGAGNENGGDFGDFAALSSAQEEGNVSPSGSTAPDQNKQQQQQQQQNQ